ncbi:hypothetical protein OUZ56_016796 [Daphnia magna]|uniref:Uncharacterized protein n=1 Tax=Daphnia magna TaxID=35525 RepID=A0ABR0ARM3_9CRUS|nr:hypothetical protein OUZ56_016796 [Daphnia magna]
MGEAGSRQVKLFQYTDPAAEARVANSISFLQRPSQENNWNLGNDGIVMYSNEHNYSFSCHKSRCVLPTQKPEDQVSCHQKKAHVLSVLN